MLQLSPHCVTDYCISIDLILAHNLFVHGFKVWDLMPIAAGDTFVGCVAPTRLLFRPKIYDIPCDVLLLTPLLADSSWITCSK